MDEAQNTKTVRNIIEDAGGPASVAKGLQESGGQITVDAVYKWQSNGIPDRYWAPLMPMANVTADEIFRANEIARAEKVA